MNQGSRRRSDEQVIALGGGGFSMEDSPLLDDYILQACAKPNPTLCFVPIASGDADGYVAQFYRQRGETEALRAVASMHKPVGVV